MGAEVLQGQQLREDMNEAEGSRATKANTCEGGLMFLSICLILTVSGFGLSIRLVGATALGHNPYGARH